jgi:hypothetical protein
VQHRQYQAVGTDGCEPIVNSDPNSGGNIL